MKRVFIKMDGKGPKTYTVKDVNGAIRMFCEQQHIELVDISHMIDGRFRFKTQDGNQYEGTWISEDKLEELRTKGMTEDDYLRKQFMDNVRE